MPMLLLATRNSGKLQEYSLLFQDIPFQLTTLAEEGIEGVAEEGWHSLEDNARLKASAYAAHGDMITLADDSGLEVEALGGEPGVLSSRYAAEGASDEENLKLLLSRLRAVPWERRSACFRCVIALAYPGGEVKLCEGECRGIITLEPRGSRGFGYDPVFYLPELSQTMAELSTEVKNQVSHRGKAARKAREVLKGWGA